MEGNGIGNGTSSGLVTWPVPYHFHTLVFYERQYTLLLNLDSPVEFVCTPFSIGGILWLNQKRLIFFLIVNFNVSN